MAVREPLNAPHAPLDPLDSPAPGVPGEAIEVVATDGHPVRAWRRFDPRRVDDPDSAPAIVLCHGFVQNRFAWRTPTRALDDALMRLGAVLWTVEMRGRAGDAPVDGLHIYVDDAAAVVRRIAARHPRVAYVGHSMGGLIGSALPDDARGALSALASIGAPLLPGDPRLHRRGLERPLIAAARALHAARVPFAGRCVGDALLRLVRLVDDRRVPWPLRLWAPGALDAASLAFALRDAFTDDSHAVFADLLELLITDAKRAGGVEIASRLEALRTPLLVIAGDEDDLAPPAGARPLFVRARSVHKEYLEAPCGHIDLLVGRHAPATVWAPVASFLRRHLGLPHGR